MRWLDKCIVAKYPDDPSGSIGEYAKDIGSYYQRINQLLYHHRNADSLLTILCQSRRVAGFSWEKMGRMLDDEYVFEIEEPKEEGDV